MKLILRLVIIFLAVVLLLNTVLLPNDYKQCDFSSGTNCPKAEAIVVLSGGDTRARTEHGVKLYKSGIADKIIFSGAAYQDGVPSNAKEMANIAFKSGVLQSDILVEEESRNTYQNAQFVKDTLDNFDFHKIILVTSAYHQRRANVEFHKFLGLSVTIYNFPLLEDKDWSKTWYLSPRGWYLAVRELGGLILASTGNSR